MRSVYLSSFLTTSAFLLFCVPGYSSTPDLTELLTPKDVADELLIPQGSGQDIKFLKSSRMQIVIHKASVNETLVVTLDGKQIESWPTSTGRDQWETSPSGDHDRYFTSTPDGRYRIFKMIADYRSQSWGNAEMSNSMFFDGGIAIHGIDPSLESKLGTPASGGCVRLSQTNAKTLWDQVKSVGVHNVLVIVMTDAIAAQAQTSTPAPVAQATPSAGQTIPPATPVAPNWP